MSANVAAPVVKEIRLVDFSAADLKLEEKTAPKALANSAAGKSCTEIEIFESLRPEIWSILPLHCVRQGPFGSV
jgi:hypothetical protein